MRAPDVIGLTGAHAHSSPSRPAPRASASYLDAGLGAVHLDHRGAGVLRPAPSDRGLGPRSPVRARRIREQQVTARLRLALLVARPAVVFLLGLSGLVGLALGGQADDAWAVGRLLVLVTAFVVYAVSCNDLSDLEVDRVNLPGDTRRPLVTGTAGARDLYVLAAASAGLATLAAATQGLLALGLTLGGLALAAAYSLPPFRISRRGVVAPLVLPALFVGLPFVLGVLAGRQLRAADLAVLTALYVGFIGRIVLKDFRDVVGDRMFGKRTFLVRHGRRVTCALSALCWVSGTALLVVATPGAGWTYVAGQALCATVAVAMVVALAG